MSNPFTPLIHSCITPFQVYAEPICIFKTLTIPAQKHSAVLEHKHQEAAGPHPQTRNQNEVPQLHAARAEFLDELEGMSEDERKQLFDEQLEDSLRLR